MRTIDSVFIFFVGVNYVLVFRTGNRAFDDEFWRGVVAFEFAVRNPRTVLACGWCPFACSVPADERLSRCFLAAVYEIRDGDDERENSRIAKTRASPSRDLASECRTRR